MGYFLLGRDADTVSLVSPSLFDSRQAALAELSRISATGDGVVPDEVFVVDLDSATPVLIVSAAAPAPPVGEAVAKDAEAIVIEAPSESASATEVADASVWEAPSESEAEPEMEAGGEPTLHVEPLVDPAIANAIVADLESDAQVEDSPAPLHDALKRAAGAMESSGIVPPESVLPAPDSPTLDVESAPAAGWPWDTTAPEPSAAYVPDPLEEPSLDDGDLIRTAEPDSEEFESRPVIMGAYEETLPPVSEPASVLPPEIPAPPSAVDEPMAPPIEESAGEPDDAVSGLLADLEEIPVASPAHDADETPQTPEPEPKPYEPGESDLGELKCDDCVYLNTCPKRGDSRPSDCGSFQWRTI